MAKRNKSHILTYNKKLKIKNMKFTFKTEAEYHRAQKSGRIEYYDIVRIVRKMKNGDEWDIPTHSEEGFNELMEKYKNDPNIVETLCYEDVSYYDIEEYL
ncbi:MAG: hypothetical protein WCK82_03975 [Bacteroidota bacterium]